MIKRKQNTQLFSPLKVKGKMLLCFLWIWFAQYTQAQSPHRINFGARGGFNYSMSGTRYGDYNGEASPMLSFFLSYRKSPWLTYYFEPGYSGTSFRQTTSETSYGLSLLESNLFAAISPSPNGSDLNFLFGFRPSVVVTSGTQILQNGSYTIVSDPLNLNSKGQIDLGLMFGISLAMSPVVSLEMCYNLSMTDKNTQTMIHGRPSTLEFGIRINALGYQSMVNSKQQQLQDRLNRYKNGALLIMLTTPDSSVIRAVRKAAGEEAVPAVHSTFAANNLTIMREFKSEFNFCPVYFYYDVNANKVTSHNTKGILLNNILQPDSSLTADSTNYFIASICNDNSEYTGRLQLGLYVYDDQLKQLDKPFNPNLIDFMNDGNPLNYFNGKKLPLYNFSMIRKKVRKLNARLYRYLE